MIHPVVFRALLLLYVLAAAAGCGTEPEPTPPRWVHVATPVEGLPPDADVRVWLDGATVRTIGSERDEQGVALVIDGRVGPPLDDVSPVVFSPDGAHHAYVARRGESRVVVLDGDLHAEVEAVAMHDGKPALVFSEDGTAFGFLEPGLTDEDEPRARAWFQGKPGPWFDDVTHLAIAPDGSGHAYVAQGPKDDLRRVVRDGAAGPAFRHVGPLAYAPDGERLAYYALGKDLSGLFVDNVPQAHGMTDIRGAPVFSPDGAHILTIESAEGGWRVVVDGAPGKTYERIEDPGFLPDGRTPRYRAGDARAMRWVRGTEEGPALPAGRPPGLAPDGRTSAHVREDDDGARVVIDGEAGPAFDAVLSADLHADVPARFLDADTLRYLARRDGELLLVEATRR